jgi:predicted nucleotidyltransferase
MERSQVIAALKAHEAELRNAGVVSASVFGSVARGEDSADDVDLAVRLGKAFPREASIISVVSASLRGVSRAFWAARPDSLADESV